MYVDKTIDFNAESRKAQSEAMLKLSAAAKSAGSSYLNKTWTILILGVALAYSFLTLFIGNPLESRGFSKKQMDAAFAVIVISLCFTGMALSKDKNASLESEVERLLRESYKPRVSEPFQVKLLTYIIGTPDEIANLLDNCDKDRREWDVSC